MAKAEYEDIPELEGWLSLPEAGDLLHVTRQRVFQMGAEEGKLQTLRRIRGAGPRPAAYVVGTPEILALRALEVCDECREMRARDLLTEFCTHTEYAVPATVAA